MGVAITIIIVIVVALIIVYAVRHSMRIAKGKESCCGGGSGETSHKKTRHVDVDDTDPAHYPYTTELTVRGMSCEGCVENVQNALNALPGTWASVDLTSRIATIRTKEPVEREVLERAVEDAGYSIIRV